MVKIVLCAVLWLVASTTTGATEGEAKGAKDSYLAALKNSHAINVVTYKGNPVRISRGDYNVQPSHSYDYSLTSGGYGPPPSTGNELYLPAHKEYGPPPKPVYGPPKPIYGPPPPPAGPVNHGMPYFSPETWLLSKLKFKFNLFTFAKILLKLVIFKKIIKFIALLCLLFFIPTLKPSSSHGDDSSEEERRRSYDAKFDYERRLDDMTQFARTALDAFSVDGGLEGCVDDNFLMCRLKRMFNVIDEAYPVSRMYSIYGADEDRSEEPKNGEHDPNVGQEEQN
ncbi:uncharacterized protein LOC131206978 [Anopheles bellator]|uniref:uncharacterized protein LOC131206978 n=1 Tax=Anopheles bellator TaxID=139047 RepID=UPI00264979C1|nr:uncharacterized protein LOC131206978 [Anopheles bellator]